MEKPNCKVETCDGGAQELASAGFGNKDWLLQVEPYLVRVNNDDGTEEEVVLPNIAARIRYPSNPSNILGDDNDRSENAGELPTGQESNEGGAEDVEMITLSSDEEDESTNNRPGSWRHQAQFLQTTGIAAVYEAQTFSETIHPRPNAAPLTYVHHCFNSNEPLDLRVLNEPLDLRVLDAPLDLTVRFEPLDCTVHQPLSSDQAADDVKIKTEEDSEDLPVTDFLDLTIFEEETEERESNVGDDLGQSAPSLPLPNEANVPQEINVGIENPPPERIPQQIEEPGFVAEASRSPPDAVNQGAELENQEQESTSRDDNPKGENLRRSSRLAAKIKKQKDPMPLKVEQPKRKKFSKEDSALNLLEEATLRNLDALISETAPGTVSIDLSNPTPPDTRVIMHDPPHNVDRNIVFTQHFRDFFAEIYPEYELEPGAEFGERVPFLQDDSEKNDIDDTTHNDDNNK